LYDLMHRLTPGSSLMSIPNAGHLPTLEQPAATIAALATWLANRAVNSEMSFSG
jgi:pimeloyl-ACP methyl ester carboxylesterase